MATVELSLEEAKRIDNALRFVYGHPADGYIVDPVARKILKKIAKATEEKN